MSNDVNVSLRSKEDLAPLKALVNELYEKIPESFIVGAKEVSFDSAIGAKEVSGAEGKAGANRRIYRPDNPFRSEPPREKIANFLSIHFGGGGGNLGEKNRIVKNNKIFLFLTLEAFAFYIRGIYPHGEEVKYFLAEPGKLVIHQDYLNKEILTEFVMIVQEFGLDAASKWLSEGYDYLNMDNEILRMDKLYPALSATVKFLLFENNPLMESARRNYVNEIEIDRTKIETSASGKKCRFCGSMNTISYLLQTKSMDEGATMIVSCVDCGKKT